MSFLRMCRAYAENLLPLPRPNAISAPDRGTPQRPLRYYVPSSAFSDYPFDEGEARQAMALHRWRAVVQCLVGSIALALLTLVCFRLRLNPATATCLYLIVIVLLSLGGNFLSSAVVSLIAVGCLAYFFAPPAFSFRVSEQLTKAGSWAYKHPDVCEYCPRRCFAYSASIPQKGIGQATSFSLVRVEEAFNRILNRVEYSTRSIEDRIADFRRSHCSSRPPYCDPGRSARPFVRTRQELALVPGRRLIFN